MALERPGFRLTAEAENDSEDFYRLYGSINGCRCHLCPPCSYCTHPGNPANLEEDDSAWEPDGESPRMQSEAQILLASGDVDAVDTSGRRYTVIEQGAAVGKPSLTMEIGKIEGVRFIKSLLVPLALSRYTPKIRPPKEPNPEIQTAAEAKRQRKLERNRRLAK